MQPELDESTHSPCDDDSELNAPSYGYACSPSHGDSALDASGNGYVYSPSDGDSVLNASGNGYTCSQSYELRARRVRHRILCSLSDDKTLSSTRPTTYRRTA